MNAMPKNDSDAVVYATTITPDIAREILSRNDKNRKLRPYHVAAIARDMRAGRFVMNGDPIRICANGELMDGQHRLSALIQANMPFRFVVVDGLSEKAMETIDGGMKRTHGDRLHISGVENAKAVSATLSVLAILAGNSYRQKMTAAETFAAYARHPDVSEAARRAKNTGFGLDSILGAFNYIGHHTGYGDAADEFLDVFKRGIAASEIDPALTARERIIKARSGIARMHRDGLIAILCAAWEAKRNGRTLSRINVGSYQKTPSVYGWEKRDMPID